MGRRAKIRKPNIQTQWRLATERKRLKRLEEMRDPESALERWSAHLRKRERHISGLRSKAQLYTGFAKAAEKKFAVEVGQFHRACENYVPRTKAASKKR